MISDILQSKSKKFLLNSAQTGFNSVIHIEDYTEEGGRSLNLEEQYDRIYKYLYFRLHDQHTAEDLTQETFLRFIGSRTYQDENRQLQYLYTIPPAAGYPALHQC